MSYDNFYVCAYLWVTHVIFKHKSEIALLTLAYGKSVAYT